MSAQGSLSSWNPDTLSVLFENLEQSDAHLDQPIIVNIVRLAQYFLKDFEPHGQMQWAALVDRLDAMRVALRAITGLANALLKNPESVILSDGAIGSLLHSMLGFNAVFYTWMDTVQDDIRVAVSAAWNKIFQNILAFLRVLGGQYPKGFTQHHDISTLRSMLFGTMQVASFLFDPKLSFTFPISLSLTSESHLVVDSSLPSQDAPQVFVVENAIVAYNLLCLLLQVWVEYLSSPTPAEWFTSNCAHQLAQFASLLFERLISSECPLEPAPRVRLLLTVLRQTPALQRLTDFREVIYRWNYIVFRHRLSSDSSMGWEAIDQYLVEVFDSDSFVAPAMQELQDILRLIDAQPASTHEFLFSFVKGLALHLELPLLNEAKDAIQRIKVDDRSGSVNRIIDRRLSEAARPSGPVSAAEPDWRMASKVALQELLHPDQLTWMEDDQAPTDTQYMRRILDDASSHLTRCAAVPAEERLRVLVACRQLVGHLHYDERNASASLLLYQNLFKAMLAGGDAQITTEVRKQLFRCIGKVLSLCAYDLQEGSLDDYQVVLAGLGDGQRGVRLAAGEALRGVIAYLARAPSRKRLLLNELFVRLNDIADSIKIASKETLISSVGQAGDTRDKDVLGVVLTFLILEFKRQNPVLKAQAACQILRLTKYHNKQTPWPLFSPHTESFAAPLLLMAKAQKQTIEEVCALLQLSVPQFLGRTVLQTLPVIVAKCDSQLLEYMANELQYRPPKLIMDHARFVLSHAFMLESAASAKALQFVIDIVSKTAVKTIDVSILIQGFMNDLLCDLVVILGDEDTNVAERAHTAIRNVAKSLNPPKQPGRSQTIPDIGTFLRPHMLVLMTQLNDKLQEVQGKISVATKQKVLRSLGVLIKLIGTTVNSYAPQIMATLQTMVNVPDMPEVTLNVWHEFLRTLAPSEASAYFGTTSATLIYLWPSFAPSLQAISASILDYMTNHVGREVPNSLEDVVDFSTIPELEKLSRQLERRRGQRSPMDILENVLDRALSPNFVMAIQSIMELKTFLTTNQVFVNALTVGDSFDPVVGRVVSVLFSIASRDGDGTDDLRLLAFECIGLLGAVDPDRTDIPNTDNQVVLTTNFSDSEESHAFTLYLITDLLVPAFRSTSDTKYQGYLGFGIQELLKLSKFTTDLLVEGPSARPPSAATRRRWKSLPKHVLETITPLLGSKFSRDLAPMPKMQHPLYPRQHTYREWIQLWTTYLIDELENDDAQTLFSKLKPAVSNNDVVVAHQILPHLILHFFLQGSDVMVSRIRAELITVLDQVNCDSGSSDKRLLSAQAVFMLLDHVNKWVQKTRRLGRGSCPANMDKSRFDSDNRRRKIQVDQVDAILLTINQELMAKAAFQCKAYARSLMSFERHIQQIPEDDPALPDYYERLHVIYALLDEPDGMEGVSTLILSPTLEHQILQHESMGRWTSAQSCWEVRLQQSPDNLDFHLGLLRCLRNLGHYDTLSTHVRGVLTRHPEWAPPLSGFQVESAWKVGDWDEVRTICCAVYRKDPELVIARVMLAIRDEEEDAVQQALSDARLVLGAPIAAAGGSYGRSYDSVLQLHLVHELEVVHRFLVDLRGRAQISQKRKRRELSKFSDLLEARLEATLPTFRTRELLLSMRRTAFRLSHAQDEASKTWLASAKIARKAGQWQVAYSALLQAKQGGTSHAFIESSKLARATGDPLRAITELENSMKVLGFLGQDTEVLDLTGEAPDESTLVKAKAQLLRSKWNNEARRVDAKYLTDMFKEATTTNPKSESTQFRYGQFQDECFKSLRTGEKVTRGLKMNVVTVECYAKALQCGSKYVYQTVPRLFALWWDVARLRNEGKIDSGYEKYVKQIDTAAIAAFRTAPAYQWFTAFPQIVSRIGTATEHALIPCRTLIVRILEEYPTQAVWLFISATKSLDITRRNRAKDIFQVIKGKRDATAEVKSCIIECDTMVDQLLALCNSSVAATTRTISMEEKHKALKALANSQTRLIIPLQESLTVTLPPSSAKHDSRHEPFLVDVPTFAEFVDEIEVMSSLARPRKISLRGSNNQFYSFLGKPTDDLRKDARLMDLNSIINKLLKSNSESRRRRLHVRTYGVVPLNEDCGFIQWVPNTTTLRLVLEGAGSRPDPELVSKLSHQDKMTDTQVWEVWSKIIEGTPAVMHEWFIQAFPEPTAWLVSRLNFSRTAAVMSIVGWVLGLGDRHCENILMDVNTGDVVHVDFNVLFEKGKDLNIPERVPFRLTRNLREGMGITGVEGVFRISCEVTMDILRNHKDPLVSVLDAFVHDPLIEFTKQADRRRYKNKAPIKVEEVANKALNLIESKLRGVHSPNNPREISTKSLVQLLITEATNIQMLYRMYYGWASWH